MERRLLVAVFEGGLMIEAGTVIDRPESWWSANPEIAHGSPDALVVEKPAEEAEPLTFQTEPLPKRRRGRPLAAQAGLPRVPAED